MSSSDSDIVILENARVAIVNAAIPEIAVELEEVGIDAAALAEGQAFLDGAITAYDGNQREDNETGASYVTFTSLFGQVKDIYRKDRTKARVVFRKDKTTLRNLGITGTMPQSYVNIVETIETFYTVASANTEIQGKLARLKVTPEVLSTSLAKVQELKEARSLYLLEKGESQQATIDKDTAISSLCEWLRDFKDIAKLALEDKPQLLEALGIHVRR